MFPPDVPGLIPQLINKSVEITADPFAPSLGNFLRSMIPIVVILGGWLIFNKTQSGKSSGSGFGKGKSTHLLPFGVSKISFQDVAGIEEAQGELTEIYHH
jgi:cell division protease FtsH